MADDARELRKEWWIKATGLPPPEERGWTPPPDPETETWNGLTVREKLAVLKRDSNTVVTKVLPLKRRGWSDPSWRNNSDPWMENAVRALEDRYD